MDMQNCWGIAKKIKFWGKPTGGKLFCDQHRVPPKHFMILAITGALFS